MVVAMAIGQHVQIVGKGQPLFPLEFTQPALSRQSLVPGLGGLLALFFDLADLIS